MKKKVLFLIILLIFLNIVAWIAIKEKSEYLEVVYFDVGQGDSTYIETSSGFQILIDGGPDLTVLKKLDQEMPFYDRDIDLIILSHPDSDHLFGLLEVLKRYEVKNILWTGVLKDTGIYQEWLKSIKEEGANILIAKKGEKISLSDDLYLIIHHPLENLEGQEIKSLNDTSIVLELVNDKVSFLFPGDISCKVEEKIDLDIDILKVAHHGSKTSSCKDFLEKASPEVAIVSVGENNWNHPHPDILANLKEFGIKTLVTKEYGDIKIISNGDNFIIKK